MLETVQIFNSIGFVTVSRLPCSSSSSTSSTSSSRYRLQISCCSPVSASAQVQKSQYTPLLPASSDGDGENKEKEEEEEEGDGEADLPGIHVPRQRHIPVSKSELVDAIVSNLFESDEETREFIRLASFLDSILHAEHKSILEEIRVYFDLSQSMGAKGRNDNKPSISEQNWMPKDFQHDSILRNFINNGKVETFVEDKDISKKPILLDSTLYQASVSSSLRNVQSKSLEDSSNTAATRFQRALMQLLCNAEFEELSARDLMLTSALNTDYLLTLPVYVDWKKSSDSNAIIFRRGYSTERQKGLLIVEKLDYLQSKLFQRILFSVAKPLKSVGISLIEAVKTRKTSDAEDFMTRIKIWLNEFPFVRQLISDDEDFPDDLMSSGDTLDSDLPIWIAAERAVTRYQGMLSAVGPRGRLLRKLLASAGLLPRSPQQTLKFNSDGVTSEPYTRPIFLPRISLSDLWTPASPKSCGNNFWKMLKTAISVLFSRSILQEPAFQELFLMYTDEMDEKGADHKAEVPQTQLKIYEKIPIPDLPVIFPHKKLSFRILDTLRLDIATILGLLAYFINYKFEDLRSSPSAIVLDVIAVSALVIYATRVVLGYKQTRDRYQLLVNRTLYEKTVASGFGSVHFLIDASEQQQYKEAILAYAILLKAGNSQMSCARNIGEKCEKFLYTIFREKVEMPIEKARNTLARLGMITQKVVDGKMLLQAVPCPKASQILEERWISLLG